MDFIYYAYAYFSSKDSNCQVKLVYFSQYLNY